jgi:RsiW-degrading membrane proteinase PrsW (M82 family)
MPTINGPPQESIPSDESMAAGPQAHLNTEAHKGKDLFNALVPARAWMQDKQLRSWTTVLLLVLVAVPAYALSQTSLAPMAWIFAVYFAVAWLLLLYVIVRPEHIGWGSFSLVAGLALIAGVPIVGLLERSPDINNPFAAIFTVGLPEELTKLVPVLVIAVLAIRGVQWVQDLHPRDYLFLGVISGLVFGAVEADTYLAQGREIITQSGQLTALAYIDRFLTDSVAHALWAGIAAYFIGLAVQEYKKGMQPKVAAGLGCVGLALAAILHGLNDWGDNSSYTMLIILVTLASALLFLGYARVGASPDALQAAVQAPLKVKEEEETS